MLDKFLTGENESKRRNRWSPAYFENSDPKGAFLGPYYSQYT